MSNFAKVPNRTFISKPHKHSSKIYIITKYQQ